jgi:thiopeptide-type bacteriocin biosynthesis protein
MAPADRGAAGWPGWHSLHVHRYGGQDEFLVDGLAPVVASLRESGAVSGFFFLRYWQGGHHVRVRLRLAAADAEQVLAEVTAKLGGYLAEFPSGADFDAEEFRREAQPTMAALENEQAEPVYPPDTIRRVPYEPELAKYGGGPGVAVAEEFFGRSSETVLATLPGLAGRSGKRLGTGLSMMLRGLCAAGLSPAAMADFFAHYCLLWSPYTFEQFVATWPDLLRARHDATLAHAEAVLAHADSLAGDPFAAAVAGAWSAVDARADEILPAVTLLGPQAPASRRRQVLLVSYLHTHNNRLGLIPEHESFLGYLGHHVLSSCAGTAPAPDLLQTLRNHRERRLGMA